MTTTDNECRNKGQFVLVGLSLILMPLGMVTTFPILAMSLIILGGITLHIPTWFDAFEKQVEKGPGGSVFIIG